jgi:transposase-like protein
MTSEQLAIVERMRAKGKSYRQIARRMGMSPGAISWYCLRYAIEGPKGRIKSRVKPGAISTRGNHVVRRFTPEEDQKIVEMRLSGMSINVIAGTMGRATSSILGRLMTLAAWEERHGGEAG